MNSYRASQLAGTDKMQLLPAFVMYFNELHNSTCLNSEASLN